MKILIKIYIFI